MTVLLLFFPIWITFISFSSLIAMVRTSKTMLSNSGTFGASEEQVVGAVDTQHCFGMSLRHVDTLQRGRAAALGGRERVDDTSGEGRGKDKHTHTHTHTYEHTVWFRHLFREPSGSTYRSLIR